MTHRVCRDIFVSQTNLFNSRYTFSKKDDFFDKEHEPYGLQRSRSEYKVSCYGFTTFGHLGNHFTMVASTCVLPFACG